MIQFQGSITGFSFVLAVLYAVLFMWLSEHMCLSFCQKKTGCATVPFVIGFQHFELLERDDPRLFLGWVTSIIQRNKVFFVF